MFDPGSVVLQTGGSVLFLVLAGVMLVLPFVAIWSAIEIVDADERKALTVFGEYRTILEPGINFVPPFVSRTYRIEEAPEEVRRAAESDLDDMDGTPPDDTGEMAVDFGRETN